VDKMVVGGVNLCYNYFKDLLQNNISANFSKFLLQNFKSSSAYNWQRETKRKAGFSFWNERTDYTKYITYKHRRFLNFSLRNLKKLSQK